MSFEFYSLLLSYGVVGLGVLVSSLLVAYGILPFVRQYLQQKGYYFYILWIGIISALSTLAALTYQFVYGLEVCSLCWWQRIFMFPIEVITFFSLVEREKATHLITGTLATIGAGFAGYHYYNHFQNFVLGQDVILPCGAVGLVPSCSDSYFIYFGFLTLPFMALIAFLSIIVLSFLAHHAKQR